MNEEIKRKIENLISNRKEPPTPAFLAELEKCLARIAALEATIAQLKSITANKTN